MKPTVHKISQADCDAIPCMPPGLHEERAVLLGRLGQHHQALSIYTLTLKDTQAALRYCQKHYTTSGPGSEVSEDCKVEN